MPKVRMVLPVLTIIVISLFLVTGCGAKSAPEPGRYYDKARGFSIKFPTGWDLQQENGGATIVALSPEENENDMFFESVSVTVEDLPYKVSLEEFAKENDKVRSTEFGGAQEEQRGDLALANAKAKWVLFTYEMQEGTVKTLDCCTVKGRRAYLIMCDSEPDKYDSYREILEGAATSFRIE